MSTPMTSFLLEAARSAPLPDDDVTATRILDGALAQGAAHGLDGFSLEAVARRAGVNRVTIYRRFGDREGLLAALAAREGWRMTEAVLTATSNLEDPTERLVEIFIVALNYVHEHPVLQRAATIEPEGLIAAGMAHDAALLRVGAALLADAISQAQADSTASTVDPYVAGETL
ncbi:MAG: helix-turn-helix domain-containing protein, partial [Aeromicrobium sp.]